MVLPSSRKVPWVFILYLYLADIIYLGTEYSISSSLYDCMFLDPFDSRLDSERFSFSDNTEYDDEKYLEYYPFQVQALVHSQDNWHLSHSPILRVFL